MTTIDFEFQELCLRDSSGRLIPGMMLYGTAELTNDNEDDPANWHVESVTLEGGQTTSWLIAKAFPRSLEAHIFRIVSNELCNSRTELGDDAAEQFAEALGYAAIDAADARADYLNDMARSA